jgi:L-alanine-DL-glutamate epimerase-like enolase superfamily enzyme
VDAWDGRTEAMIETIGRRFADHCTLIADANGGFSVTRAIEIGRRLTDHGFDYFEEPVPAWLFEETADVKDALTSIAVIGGDVQYNPRAWREIIEMEIFRSLIQPDITYVGGITMTLRLAELAERYGLEVMPHTADQSLLTAFALHLLAALPNAGPFLEYNIEETPWTDRLLEVPFLVTNGTITVPQRPGWGVRVNWDWLQAAQVRRTDSA